MGKIALVCSVFMFSNLASAVSFEPTTECGIYQVRGKLSFDNNDNLTIRIPGGTPSELILVGKGLEKAISKEGEEISAEIFVPAKIDGSRRPFVELKKFLPEMIDSNKPVVMVSKKSCKNEVEIKWKEPAKTVKKVRVDGNS